MDVFVEQMVVKKKTGKDLARTAACALGGAVALFLIVSFLGQYLGFLTFLIVVGVFYLLYQVVIGSNIEYEYSFTNGAMDVDKIIAASRRKRMTALNAREIEMMGTKRNAAFDGYIKNGEIKKVYACTSIDDNDVCFVLYTEGGVKKLLLFNPNEKIRDGFRRLNPQKVFLND